MSMECTSFSIVPKCLRPSYRAQQVITKRGFELQLDHDFDPFTFTGFLPCRLSERVTGFEYYFSGEEAHCGTGNISAASTAAL